MKRKKTRKEDTYSAQRECRLLKSQGYTDDELVQKGFDQATISRAVVSVGGKRGLCVPKERCIECGWQVYYLRKGSMCRACVMKLRMEKEGHIDLSVKKPAIAVQDSKPKTFSHPAILGS